MRKHTLVLAVFVFAFSISAWETKQAAQQIQHEAVAINIEVPVRVFKGQTFIDNLSISDFEIYEDGVLQKIEAVYFIRKNEIERKEITDVGAEKKEEAEQRFTPDPSRTFVLMFEIVEYLPEIGEVLDHFFESVIRPGDSLIVATPMKTYNLNKQALERVSKEEITKQLNAKLRADANLGSSDYRSQLNYIKTIDEMDTTIAGMDKKFTLMSALRHLQQLAYFDEKRAMDFANFLKAIQGQKHVFFFFQKRTIPIPKELTDIDEMELLHEISLDSNKIRDAFADASIACHFLYITKSYQYTDSKRPLPLTGKVTKAMESSAGSYRGFSEIAEVTGGLIDSSANAAASFEKAVDYSESYYLLYYSPKNYVADSKFKMITVKVKGGNFRITHRAGYIAD